MTRTVTPKSLWKKADLQAVKSSDYPSLAQYLASFPDETRSKEFWLDRFRIWWDENPAFEERLERGWILKDEDTVVGFLCHLPLLFQVRGKPQVTFAGSTFRVHPAYRRYSLRLVYRQFRSTKGTFLFFTTTNLIATRVLQMLKCLPIERGHEGRGYERSSFILLQPKRFWAQHFSSNPLARILAGMGGFLLRALQDYRLRGPTVGEDFQVKEIQHADASFDELWEETRHRFPFTIVRTSRMLNWYCFGSPHFQKKLFGLWRKGHLEAYAIMAEKQDRDLRSLDCLDWWGPESLEVGWALVEGIKKYAQTNGYDLIKFPGFSGALAHSFGQMGLFQTTRRQSPQFYRLPSGESAALSDAEVYWSYFLGDIGL